MEEEEDGESFFSGGPHASLPPFVSRASFITTTSITPSPSHRLSSNFSEPNRPIPTVRRLSWVNLQGRLVNAEEASCSKAIGGSLSKEEGLAWDLFSPIHRILIVAVVAVATADLRKSRQIWQLKRSVDLRDEVLLSMQQKLDDLCEHMNTMKDHPEHGVEVSFTKNKEEFSFNEEIKLDECNFSSCGCRLCDHHQRDSVEKASSEDEMFKFKPLMIRAEQEERRMSDLSDLASSVTSAADIQLNTLAIEQDIYNLQRECEEKDATIKEKDATIKELSAAAKRITELEELLRRKNMIITKQKKDIAVLDQKVVHLTRLRRPSTASTLTIKDLPMMADNVLYDISSTSPSSSDSDSPIENRTRVLVNQELQETPTPQDVAAKRIFQTPSAKPPISLPKSTYRTLKSRPVSPLTENSMNQRPGSPSGDPKRNRRRIHSGSKDSAQSKRWF